VLILWGAEVGQGDGRLKHLEGLSSQEAFSESFDSAATWVVLLKTFKINPIVERRNYKPGTQ